MDFSNLFGISPKLKRVRFDTKNSNGRYSDNENLITIVLKGELYFTANGTTYNLGEGTCLLLPPTFVHLVTQKENLPLEQFVIHFDYFEYIAESETQNPFDDKIIAVNFSVVDKLKIREKCKQLLEISQSLHLQTGVKKLYEKSLLLEILALIFRSEPLSMSTKTPSINPIVKRAVTFIYENFTTPSLTIQNIAKHLNVSPSYLAASFKNNTKITLHEFLLNTRIEKAKELLQSGIYNVSEVATLCGFSSIHSFSRAFKDATSATPTSFRNSYQ